MSTLKQLEEYARERYIPVMLDDTKELLFNTVKERQPESILEIGTAIGYSGIVMLTAAPESTLNTIEFSEKSVALARKNFAEFDLTDRVNIFVGDAREIVPLLTGKYDFIFWTDPRGSTKRFILFLPICWRWAERFFPITCSIRGLSRIFPKITATSI